MSYDHTAENLFFSPLGLLSALAVVFFGARGDSASQMEKCEQDTGVHPHIQALLSEISKSSYSQVHMASGMFAEEAHPFLLYLDFIEQLYKLKPESVDFKNNLEEARMQISSWIENKTEGEIKGLLSPNILTSSDQLVLVNAISFRGTWKYAFQKDQTQTIAFQLDEVVSCQSLFFSYRYNICRSYQGSAQLWECSIRKMERRFYQDSWSDTSGYQSKPVQTMRLQGRWKLGFIKEPRGQVLEMPDAEDHLSVGTILPGEGVGLGQVTKEITYEKLKIWTGSANTKDTAVALYLPRLRPDVCHEDVTSTLEALGMTDVFDPSRANLSGISAGGGLMVSKIIHKAMLEVVECGSETILTDQTSRVENLEIFTVDRLFLFFILPKETKTILFYGIVSAH